MPSFALSDSRPKTTAPALFPLRITPRRRSAGVLLVLAACSLAAVAAEEEAVTLPRFTVSEQLGVGYRTAEATSLSRMAIPTQDLPFTVNILNRKFIDDLGTLNLNDVLLHVPATSSGQAANSPNLTRIRGLTANILIDGTPYGSEAAYDPVFLNRIEVTKGPSIVQSPIGGSAGGTILFSLKRPERKTGGYASVQTGLFNSNRVEADYNQVFNGERTVIRVFGALQDGDGFEEAGVWRKKLLGFGVSHRLSPTTTLTVREFVNDERRPPDTGQPFIVVDGVARRYPGIPRERTIFSPGDYRYNRNQLTYVDLQFSLNESTVGTIGFNHVSQAREREINIIGGPTLRDAIVKPDGTVVRVYSYLHDLNDLLRVYNDYASAFELGPTKHRLLIGADARRSINPIGQIVADGDIQSASTNLFAPGTAATRPTNLIRSPNPVTEVKVASAYIVDSASLFQDRVHLFGGYSTVWQQNTSGNAQAQVPQYGIALKPLPTLTLYASKGESFIPSTARLGRINPATGGAVLNPATNLAQDFGAAPSSNRSSEEFGLKMSLWKDVVNFAYAHWDAREQNATRTIPASSLVEVIGDLQSKGHEVELNVQANKQIDLRSSIAWMTTRDALGMRTFNAPKRTAAFWGRYTFTEGALKGYGFALGANSVDDRLGRGPDARPDPVTGRNRANSIFVYPGYTTASAALFATWKNINVAINISNLFDRDYILSNDQLRPSVIVGEPRNIRATAAYRF
ncbi:MAG: TonB-dependent receptor [Opitutus sp.]